MLQIGYKPLKSFKSMVPKAVPAKSLKTHHLITFRLNSPFSMSRETAHPRQRLWRGILDKNVIGSYHKVHYIEFACILCYRTRYAVMSYSVMFYCNRNTVLSYSVTLYRNQNSIVFCVFTHVASIYANLLERKKAFT